MKKHKVFKVIGIVLASIAGFCVLCHGSLMTWVRVAKDNDVPLFIHNGFKSIFFIDKETQEVKDFKTKIGGVMRGVCHPHKESETLKKIEAANINWVRFDIPGIIPFELDKNNNPIEKDGEYVPNAFFKEFVEKCEYYKTFNQKLLVITPGIFDMLKFVGEESVFQFGGDFTKKFIDFSKTCARFYAEKLSPIVSGFQVCNETEIPKWRGALTTEQVTYFIGGVMMKEMHDICSKNNCIIGFNQSMLGNFNLANGLTKNYSEFFDYVGADLYAGSFEPYTKFMWINEFYVKYLYYVTRKPIIITEFGYIGYGENKTNEEKERFLRDTYGEKFDSEEKIKENFPEFIEAFDKNSRTNLADSKIEEIEFQLDKVYLNENQRQKFLKQYAPYDSVEKMKSDKLGFVKKYEEVTHTDKTCGSVKESRRIMEAGNFSKDSINEAIKFFFKHCVSHLYKICDSSIGVLGYDHTEEGQAKYLKDFVRRISKKKYVCGFFVYHLLEDKYCYECSQADCPVETGWGLLRVTKGTAEFFDPADVVVKKSYFAIQEVYAELKNI